MSNSPLVSYTKISPNKSSPRNHKIDTVTIHCVVGQCSVETLGNVFAPTSRQASSNYGVGVDGRIGMYVEEKDRSWCSSNAANDNRAITIEVASDTKEPYAVNAKAYAALIDLLVDICKRNGIKALVWSTNKADRVNHKNGCNMTVHRDYANKSCPGTYLYERHAQIASEVNKRLGRTNTNPAPEKPSGSLYRVQTGAFKVKANADAMLAKVKAKGFDTYMVKVGDLYKIQVGAFKVKANAEAMMKKLQAAGFSAFITTEEGAGKSVDELAREVLQGKWGNGAERKKRLEAAGYDYAAVQKKVNQLT
nr:MAG: N-acetylmuramoyl-L-alanine amidase [Bacteriophage sp.]